MSLTNVSSNVCSFPAKGKKPHLVWAGVFLHISAYHANVQNKAPSHGTDIKSLKEHIVDPFCICLVSAGFSLFHCLRQQYRCGNVVKVLGGVWPRFPCIESYDKLRWICTLHGGKRRASNKWFMLLIFFRARRRQAREQTGKMADHLEGLSSDDEETSTDITNFSMERG